MSYILQKRYFIHNTLFPVDTGKISIHSLCNKHAISPFNLNEECRKGTTKCTMSVSPLKFNCKNIFRSLVLCNQFVYLFILWLGRKRLFTQRSQFRANWTSCLCIVLKKSFKLKSSPPTGECSYSGWNKFSTLSESESYDSIYWRLALFNDAPSSKGLFSEPI